MSKRFGRNKRRKMREQLEQQQQQLSQQQLKIQELYKNQRNPFEPDFPTMITREILSVKNTDYGNGWDVLNPNMAVERVNYHHLKVGLREECPDMRASGYIGFVAADGSRQFSEIYIDPRQVLRAERFNELKNLAEEISNKLLGHFYRALKQGR